MEEGRFAVRYTGELNNIGREVFRGGAVETPAERFRRIDLREQEESVGFQIPEEKESYFDTIL